MEVNFGSHLMSYLLAIAIYFGNSICPYTRYCSSTQFTDNVGHPICVELCPHYNSTILIIELLGSTLTKAYSVPGEGGEKHTESQTDRGKLSNLKLKHPS